VRHSGTTTKDDLNQSNSLISRGYTRSYHRGNLSNKNKKKTNRKTKKKEYDHHYHQIGTTTTTIIIITICCKLRHRTPPRREEEAHVSTCSSFIRRRIGSGTSGVGPIIRCEPEYGEQDGRHDEIGSQARGGGRCCCYCSCS